MDVLSALSKAADITKPGVRDQLPVASVVLTIAALWTAGAPYKEPEANQVASRLSALGVVGLTVLVLGLFAASILLQPLFTSIENVLLGEASRRLGWLDRPLRRRHERRLQRLESQLSARYAEEDAVAKSAGRIRLARGANIDLDRDREIERIAAALRGYPSRYQNVRATGLGNNVLAATDEHAGGRYGLDTAVVRPRLEPLLEGEISARVKNREDDLRFAVRLAAALIVTALASAALLLPPVLLHASGYVWLCIPGGALMLAWASYRNAITASVQFGEALAVAFDLKRFLLYQALHQPLPRDLDEERLLATQISRALWTGEVEVLRYTKPDDAADPA